jgi:hypothetical protein
MSNNDHRYGTISYCHTQGTSNDVWLADDAQNRAHSLTCRWKEIARAEQQWRTKRPCIRHVSDTYPMKQRIRRREAAATLVWGPKLQYCRTRSKRSSGREPMISSPWIMVWVVHCFQKVQIWNFFLCVTRVARHHRREVQVITTHEWPMHECRAADCNAGVVEKTQCESSKR